MKQIVVGGASPEDVQSLAAGVAANPETLSTGGALAAATLTFTANPTSGHAISISGVRIVFGTDVTIGGSTNATMDNLATFVAAHPQLGGLVVVTDNGSNVATVTSKAYGASNIGLSSENANCVASAANLANGVKATIDLRRRTSIFAISAASDQKFVLPPGLEGQEKRCFMSAKSSTGNAVIESSPGNTIATLAAAGQSVILEYLAGAWRVLKTAVDAT